MHTLHLTVEIQINFESGVQFQLKEAGLWDSATVMRSSSSTSFTAASCALVSPSRRTHLIGQSPRSSRAHGRHVHQAGYQQLMDIINLPRRSAVGQPSAVLKTANCGSESPSARITSSSVNKSTSRSVQNAEGGARQDETLKPTDILVQLVDTLWRTLHVASIRLCCVLDAEKLAYVVKHLALLKNNIICTDLWHSVAWKMCFVQSKSYRLRSVPIIPFRNWLRIRHLISSSRRVAYRITRWLTLRSNDVLICSLICSDWFYWRVRIDISVDLQRPMFTVGQHDNCCTTGMNRLDTNTWWPLQCSDGSVLSHEFRLLL